MCFCETNLQVNRRICKYLGVWPSECGRVRLEWKCSFNGSPSRINIDMVQAVANLARNRANQEQDGERDTAEHFYRPSQGHCAEAQHIGVDRFPGFGERHLRDGRTGVAEEDSRTGRAGQLRSTPSRAVDAQAESPPHYRLAAVGDGRVHERILWGGVVGRHFRRARLRDGDTGGVD